MTSNAALEEEKSSKDGEKQADGDQQQARGDGGKPKDIATGIHTDNTTRQSPDTGKGKGEDRKQDGDGGGVRQRKGTSGGGKVGITDLPS